MTRSFLRAAALAFAFSALLPLAAAGDARPAAQPAKARLIPLEIRTAHGVRRFEVEVARTPAEQERGLMFRTSLPSRGGMLFPMGAPREATFWMKNTVLPLDMIFIRADGTIARIAERTVPYSLDLVDSGEPVAAVLEIIGGGAAQAGIRAGDRVIWQR